MNFPLQHKHVVQIDDAGVFTGMVMVDEDPLERGTFQMPPNTLEVEPPVLEEGRLARWNGAGWTYIEVAHAIEVPLASLRARYLSFVDASVDMIYQEVIGMRGPEYEMAEADALEYLRNPGGDVPESVQDWADIKSWPPEQAAQNLVDQAAAWRHMSVHVMRPARLRAKEALRNASDAATMELQLVTWRALVQTWRVSLGI
jgi:hypothetical protein